MGAGYDAMGRRTGEQLGESLRELAQASMPSAGRSPVRPWRRICGRGAPPHAGTPRPRPRPGPRPSR